MGKMNFSWRWLRTCIELPTALVFFSFTLAQTVAHNFVMYRSCYVDFNFNKTDCAKLGTGEDDEWLSEIEETVQGQVMVNLTVQEIINQVAPVFICMLLGAWSDTHGRRPVLHSTLLGFSLGGILALVVIYVESMSAWWFTAMSIIIAVFGGVNTFITAVICYISDISKETNRGTRMGIFEGIMTVGMFLGTILTSYIYDAGGYGTVFIILVASFVTAFLYHFFVMVESLQFNEKQKNAPKRNLFNLTQIKEMFQVTFKPRPNYGRTVLILCVILSILVKFIAQADASIYYLFLRLKLNWDMEKYTIFKAISSVLGILAAVGGTALLHHKLKIREMPLVLVAGIVSMVAMFFQALAEEDWHIYVGGALRALAGLLSPMVRTLLSKLVKPDETGKVFALSSAVESLVLLCGLLSYTGLYKKTAGSNPGAFNYITAGVYGGISLFAAWALFVQKFYQKENIFVLREKDSSKKEEEEDVENLEANGR